MKKFLSLLMAGALALSFGLCAAGCDINKGDGSDELKGVEVTEEQWNVAISDVTFDNVTFTQVGDSTITQSGGMVSIIENITIKITQDELAYSGSVTNKATGEVNTVAEQKFTGAMASAYRTTYTKIFMSVLEKKDKFVYNADLGAYTLSEEVVVEQTAGAQVVTERITNGKAIFNEQGYLVSFSCHMYETDVRNGVTNMAYDANLTWTFSQYGSTVITPPAEESGDSAVA